MRVGILGPGRLGRTFARLLSARGHDVDLRGRGEIPRGDVVLLTVPDSVLASVARDLPRGPTLLHCSGAAGIEVLRPHRPAGSLHPLMTFPGPEIAIPDLTHVPAAVAGDPEARDVAKTIAVELGFFPFEVTGDRRLYHAAAVMAGNFATVLLAEAGEALSACGLSPEDARRLLLPLALQSMRNAVEDPAKALTGPAARGDDQTIEGHRTALEEAGLEHISPLYALLTTYAKELVQLRPRSSEKG